MCRWCNPGFGTVEEMSSEQMIEEVNESRADLLAVFLSAKSSIMAVEKS